MSKEEISKKDEERELQWKVDDAIRAFSEYKKLIKDERVKEKVITELKQRAKDFEELSKKL